MTQITSIANTSVKVDFDVDQSSMTPEDVLSYCQARMNQLQQELNQRADQQRKMNRASEILANVTRALGEASGDGKNNLLAVDVNRVRQAFMDAADQIAALGPEMADFAEKVGKNLAGFDEKCRRTVHFSDGTTYELNANEADDLAISRHDGWARWNANGQKKPNPALQGAGDPNGGLSPQEMQDYVLASKWEGDVLDNRDGQTADSAGKLPQPGAVMTNVTFFDGTTAQAQIQNLRDNLKATQGILNENSQSGLDDLHNLTQQKQQALQIMQQMLQALVEQAKATQEWR